MEHREHFKKHIPRIIAKAWADPAFKRDFVNDPLAVLKKENITLPPGVTVSVNENTPTHIHITLPLKPESLTEKDLQSVSAGGGDVCMSTST